MMKLSIVARDAWQVTQRMKLFKHSAPRYRYWKMHEKKNKDAENESNRRNE
jgi:hypothetical protein